MDLIFPKKYKEFLKALHSLEIVVESEEYNDIVRDSMVIRFMYTSELFGKMLKVLLREEYQVDAAYPKEVFRMARNVKILNEEEVEICIGMLNDRNFCAHAYQEHVIEKIAQNIPLYFDVMKKIKNKIE